MKSLARERAAFILEMADADEAQRHIKPRQPNQRELEAEQLRIQNKTIRDAEWREETLPKLQKAWREASIRNATNPSTKALLIRASIVDRKAPVLWDEFYADRKVTWTEIFGRYLSTLMGQFIRRTNVGRGRLPHTHSATAN